MNQLIQSVSGFYQAAFQGGHTMKYGTLIFSGVEELDFIGPWEIVGSWFDLTGQPEKRLIVAETDLPVTCANGMKAVPDCTIQQCPTLDILLVPGGPGVHQAVNNSDLIQFITGQASSCRTVISVCTGAFLLHRAGLLSGKKATTYWNALKRLRALGDVTVVEERYVRDGHIWTAAGVSAGIDVMLAVIADIDGEETAGKVQRASEYYPEQKRYGSAQIHSAGPGYLNE
jgi:transcriptional regulator GlxA family with amidase domain